MADETVGNHSFPNFYWEHQFYTKKRIRCADISGKRIIVGCLLHEMTFWLHSRKFLYHIVGFLPHGLNHRNAPLFRSSLPASGEGRMSLGTKRQGSQKGQKSSQAVRNDVQDYEAVTEDFPYKWQLSSTHQLNSH